MENIKVFVVVRDEESESSSEILGVFSSRVDAQMYVYDAIHTEFNIDDDEYNEVERDFRGQVKYSTMVNKVSNLNLRSDFIIYVLESELFINPNQQFIVLAQTKSLLNYLYRFSLIFLYNDLYNSRTSYLLFWEFYMILLLYLSKIYLTNGNLDNFVSNIILFIIN